MKRAFFVVIVSLFILVGFSGCDLLEGVTNNPPTLTPLVKSTVTASPTTPSMPTVTASPTTPSTAKVTASPTTPSTAKVTASSTPHTAGVNQVITMYYDAIKAQNYAQAYTYLDPNATNENGQKITLSSFEQMAHTMESEGVPVASFSVAVFPPMVVMTVMRTLLSYHAHLQVQQEGQTWKITSLDRI